MVRVQSQAQEFHATVAEEKKKKKAKVLLFGLERNCKIIFPFPEQSLNICQAQLTLCFSCGLFFLSIATVPLLISAVLPFVSCSPLSPLLLKSISDRVPFSSRIFHCWFSVPWRHFTFLRYSRPVTFHSPNFALLPLSARVLLSSPWSYFVVS